jgi:uncharacterized membrane protein
LPDVTLLDTLAFAFYGLSWIGYTVFADYSSWRERSIMKAMDGYRERWAVWSRPWGQASRPWAS